MPTIHFDPAVNNPIILVVGKEQIAKQNVGDLLKALVPMTLSADLVREYGNRLRIAFDGYEGDMREVYAVPEIRQFMATVTETFPFWFHYCDKSDDSLFVIMTCLIPIVHTETVAGIATTTLQEGGLPELIGDLFGHVNGLYAKVGIGEEEQRVMTRQVGEYLRATF